MKAVYLLYLFVFPGLLFTAVFGLLVGWVDRKVSARFQFRVGPPLFQNFNDLFKLFTKETILVREGVSWVFIAVPLAAVAMLAVVSALIGVPLFFGPGFGGDLIVVMYLSMLFSVLVVLGGASTGNVYSSLGGGREIKLLMADELAFILVCLVVVIKTGYSFRFDAILAAQAEHGAVAGSASGIIALVVGLLCIQAKMTLPPFHIPEAETEIVGGPCLEYGGPLLAFWKLGHFMMYVIFPFFLILLFLGGFKLQGLGILWAFLKYLGIIVVMIIIKNTNPRLRIETALSFFWKIASPLAFLAVVLAVLGV